MTRLAHFAFLLVSTCTSAQAKLDLDQFNNFGTSLQDADPFGASQIIPDAPAFSSMVLADATFTQPVVSDVKAAIAFKSVDAFPLVTGYRVSVFANPTTAMSAGPSLQTGALGTVDVLAADAGATLLPGTGSGAPSVFQIELLNLGLSVGTGLRWIGVSPILMGGPNFEQSYVLCNTNPALVTGGLNNDVGVNPGDGYGYGGPILMDSGSANAAYSVVTTVPEPVSLIVTLGGVLTVVKRRKS